MFVVRREPMSGFSFLCPRANCTFHHGSRSSRAVLQPHALKLSRPDFFCNMTFSLPRKREKFLFVVLCMRVTEVLILGMSSPLRDFAVFFRLMPIFFNESLSFSLFSFSLLHSIKLIYYL